MTLGQALAFARERLDVVDARVLLREAAGVSNATLVAFAERALTTAQAATFTQWVARRAAGEPVAYILGWREFYGRRFAVTRATLIPRPDTELLVERALAAMQGRAAPRVLDLGTGTGAIAVSLALERADAEVAAVDASAEALTVAAQNASALGARVRCLHGDWFAPVAGERFDVVVSNPPYIAQDDGHLREGDLRFEPRGALASGEQGLDDIRRIVGLAPAHLVAGGWLLLEHGYDQAVAVRALLVEQGFEDVASWRDLAGIERVSGGRVPAR